MRRNSVKERGRRSGDRWRELSLRQIRASGSNSTRHNSDNTMFMSVSQELKEEGNRLFLKRDYNSALIKYEKSIQLLPDNHADIAYIRSNMAECYMQLGISEYPTAIHECNTALEVSPNYSKALLKRARCYEALGKPDLALTDVRVVLKTEPNNLMATEIEQRLRKIFERQGSKLYEIQLDSAQSDQLGSPKIERVIERASTQKFTGKTLAMECSTSSENGANRLDSAQSNQIGSPKIEDSAQSNQLGSPKIERVIERASTQKFTGKTPAMECSTSSENGAQGRLDKQKSCVASVSLRTKAEDQVEEKNAEDKLVVEEKISNGNDEVPKTTMKLVFGEDIRWARVPVNCDIVRLRQIIADRFPSSKAVLIKYRDHEGDMVTITSTEDLRWLELCSKQVSIKLYIIEVRPDQDPLYHKIKNPNPNPKPVYDITESEARKKEFRGEETCITDWILQFAKFFKNYLGVEADSYIDMHQIGIKLCTEALEDAVTRDEAQELLSTAGDRFVEMAALALFNCGNVHMTRARKKVHFDEDCSRESMLERVKFAFDRAQREFAKAGKRYEEALKIKPNFYEGVLALGQHQFEQAKLSWYYAIATGVDLEMWPESCDVVMLYNNAEENMERGMQMWEDQQQQRLMEMSRTNSIESLLQRLKLDHLFKEISAEEIEEQASNIRSQVYVLWGTILYERSMMEYKLGVPVWHECLEAAVEKFELAGASGTDIAVMIKNHCSNNDTTLDGLGFNIDEIVQAWDEMYEAKKWMHNLPSYRLEPLVRRRISNLYCALERL